MFFSIISNLLYHLEVGKMKNVLTLILLVLITSVSAAQWSEQTSGVTTALESVCPIDNNTVWIAGASGKVLYTSNGGTTWIITTSPNPAIDMSNIFGVNSTTALVTGSSSSATFVYRTSNAGANWTQVFTQSGGFIDAIIINDSSGWIYGDPVGGRWSIWLTLDQGVTWDSSRYPTSFYIPQSGNETGWNNSMGAAGNPYGSGYIWFGTNNSRIYRAKMVSGSGVMTWVAQPTSGIPNIYTILFGDTLHGIAGGSTGLAYTSDGGDNWYINTGCLGTGNITGIAGKNPNELWYARGSSIYYTSNDSVWTVATTQTGTYNHLAISRTPNNYNIWAIRSNGGISKYTYPIGIKPISIEVPASFSLSQNYPNPFNPETRIKFDLPKSAFTILKIYDALGREIETLVNEQLNPGTYEAGWNASNCTSGVYFYKLSAGDYTDTRRMVLLK